MTQKKVVPQYKQFAIVRYFLDGHSPAQIARLVNARFPEERKANLITSHDPLRVIQERAIAGDIRYVPPASEFFADQVSNAFGFSPEMIEVSESQDCLDTVAYQTAVGLLRLILEKSARSKKRPIHLAFGSGGSCRLVALHLSRLLRVAGPLPPLVLHALTSGFDVEKPFNAANSFFSYFMNLGKNVRVDFVGFFAPPLVGREEALEVRERPIVRDAFAARWEIDIVVTGLANYHDPHGELQRLVRLGALDAENLEASSVVGDVQYCAFNERGPLQLTDGERPLTLFELDELQQFVETPGKHVWLVCGPCGACSTPRTAALRALLSEDSLRVWSHIVTDEGTCRELLAQATTADAAETPVKDARSAKRADAPKVAHSVKPKKLAQTVEAKNKATTVKPVAKSRRKPVAS